eukprot:scpid111925/ scgid8443/ 
MNFRAASCMSVQSSELPGHMHCKKATGMWRRNHIECSETWQDFARCIAFRYFVTYLEPPSHPPLCIDKFIEVYISECKHKTTLETSRRQNHRRTCDQKSCLLHTNHSPILQAT